MSFRSRSSWTVFSVAIWMIVPSGIEAQAQTSGTSQDSSNAYLRLSPLEEKLWPEFSTQIMGLLTDSDAGCVDCHSPTSTNNLKLSGHPLEDLRRLLDEGYLSTQGPDTLLSRLTTTNTDKRMPKDGPSWKPAEIESMSNLVELVKQWEVTSGQKNDEKFPSSLLGPHPKPAPPHIPNLFLSYRQLKSKIRSIFDDDWVRGERDLFQENLAAFGGADFKTRFNETTTPTPGFLSALEDLSRDVVGHAYRNRTGPFENWVHPQANNSEPEDQQALEKAIGQLYRRILYRSPNPTELQDARKLIEDVRAMQDLISERDTELQFQVTVTDPETQLTGSQTIRIPVSGKRTQVVQHLIDQRADKNQLSDTINAFLSPAINRLAEHLFAEKRTTKIRRHLLGILRIAPDQVGQVIVHNVGTYRSVRFAGIECEPIREGETIVIPADSPLVQLEGAWKTEQQSGVSCLDDEGQHKGLSSITVTLPTDSQYAPGEYRVYVRWVASPHGSPNVLVELRGSIHRNQLVSESSLVPRQSGNAAFYFDCSNDTLPYFEPQAVFQFDAQAGAVELSNRDTLQRVTAGAVEFVNANDSENHFLIDSKLAKGAEHWQRFEPGRFGSYNVRGEKLHDGDKQKGKLSLRYELADRVDHGWKKPDFYHVRVYYPAKRDQEPRVPVTIHANRSSPIVQVDFPRRASADASLRIDASASYTVQHSPLHFSWTQIAGPRVAIQDPTQPILEFQTPRAQAEESAWVALCSALIRHPDFLFTRPHTANLQAEAERNRLHLVRIAQDLLGRPPSKSEFERLDAGASIEELVDEYLESSDFREFYFHRVRLYLESQGTQGDDEPVNLWCHIAFHDKPFQKLLTADYTADEKFQRVDRPKHHGRTGLLTTQGFISGKPGLPHYNYAAQVTMLFLGYMYEVPPEIVDQREGVTALGTTDPNSSCYSCHKILTPLAFQRLHWTDDGVFRTQDENGLEIDASDRSCVHEYPFPGDGLEAFATQAVRKERFLRTIINTHVGFYFGRPMRHLQEERYLYRRLWESTHRDQFKIRALIREIILSPEYGVQPADSNSTDRVTVRRFPATPTTSESSQ